MADILQDFPIRVSPSRAFDGVSQPRLLDQWWTVRSSGEPTVGAWSDSSSLFQEAALAFGSTIEAGRMPTITIERRVIAGPCTSESCAAIWNSEKPWRTKSGSTSSCRP
jgi:hypothetical protein